MFEDSLMESGGRLKTKRGWTTVLSIVSDMFDVSWYCIR